MIVGKYSRVSLILALLILVLPHVLSRTLISSHFFYVTIGRLRDDTRTNNNFVCTTIANLSTQIK